MDLKWQIYESRIKLDDICLDNVRPDNPSEISDIKGKVAEEMVREWLSGIEGVYAERRLPKYSGEFIMEKNSSILISKVNYENKKHNMADIDELVYYKGKPYAVEVKSMKLNGVGKKLNDKMEYTQKFYNKNVYMLLFLPFYTNKERYIEALEKDFPNLLCIDTGYKKKQLNNMIEKYLQRKN